MKKIISIILAFAISLPVLIFSSCKNTDTEKDDDATESATESTTESTTEEPVVTPVKKMDLEPYLCYFVEYFYYPAKSGDTYMSHDILRLVAKVCYDNIEYMPFVSVGSGMNIIMIDGENFRRVAKNLLGEEFEAEDYHAYFKDNENGDRYDEENDSYIFSILNEINPGSKSASYAFLKILNETENSIAINMLVSFPFYYRGKEMVYCFDKVVDENFQYYRLSDIHWGADVLATDRSPYQADFCELKDLEQKDQKYTVSIELPYYMTGVQLTHRLPDDSTLIEDAIMFYDPEYGYGAGDCVIDSEPGFDIRGIYNVESDYVLDESIAEEINDYLGTVDVRRNDIALYDPECKYTVGKTNDGNDYVICEQATKSPDDFLSAYIYVRISDDAVLYIGLFLDRAKHRDEIVEAIKTVKLVDDSETASEAAYKAIEKALKGDELVVYAQNCEITVPQLRTYTGYVYEECERIAYIDFDRDGINEVVISACGDYILHYDHEDERVYAIYVDPRYNDGYGAYLYYANGELCHNYNDDYLRYRVVKFSKYEMEREEIRYSDSEPNRELPEWIEFSFSEPSK